MHISRHVEDILQWTEKQLPYEQASTLTEVEGCRLELFILSLSDTGTINISV